MSEPTLTAPSFQVDGHAITSNTRQLAALAKKPVLAVVKANGYGHGAALSARAALAGGATWLGVADVPEAIRLRNAGITAPLLAWLHGSDPDFRAAASLSIDVGISTEQQLEAAAHAGARVHLKFDTGLGRNGFAVGDWQRVIDRADELQQRGTLRVQGVFSHLAGTSEHADRAQLAQFEQVQRLVRRLEPVETHIAASNGLIAYPEHEASLVRGGVSLYGLHPSGHGDGSGSEARALGLLPAGRLQARATADGQIAAGFAHGLLPASGAPVLVGDRTLRVAQVGAYATTVPGIRSGETATLFGDPSEGEPSVDAWAIGSATINYEITTRLGGHELDLQGTGAA
ncbi:alanine racemase [Humidisolicoccus flavus]|uniref:alanine racemase n=1 Tax=Humidisolicoccus flavus TaxID=3111414 RepID=UPI00324654B5